MTTRAEEKTYRQDSRARVVIMPGFRPEDLSAGLSGTTTADVTDPSGTRFYRDEDDVETLNAYDRDTNAFKTVELRRSLMNVDVARRLGAPGGSFAFTFKSAQTQFDFLNFIRPNDWVEVYLDNGSGERLEMVGLIDRYQESTAAANGSTVRTFNISGREAIGKILSTTEVFYDIRAKPELALADFSARVIEVKNGIKMEGITASDFIPTVMKNFGGKDGQFIHPNTGLPFLGPRSEQVDLETYVGRRRVLTGVDADEENTLLDEQNIQLNNSDGSQFRYEAGDVVDDDELITRAVIPNSLMSINGKLWSAVQRWTDPMFHTLYFDVLPDASGSLKTSLVFKQHPYDIDLFFDLPDYDVYSTEVISSNLGRSDADMLNWVKILTKMIPQGRGEAATIYAEPYLSPESLNAHGIRRAYAHTVYPFSNPRRTPGGFGPSESTDREKGFIGTLKSLNDVIARWHSFNDLLLNGTLQLGRMRNDIRLGQRVNYYRRGDDGFSFLVEGIRHQWVYMGTSTTTLNLTRGIPTYDSSQYAPFIAAVQSRVEKMGAEGVRAKGAINFGPSGVTDISVSETQ